jgi:predicted GIY-YIG superfamily endonuclease
MQTDIVYVLKLEDDCWYVGLTANLNKRLRNHFSSGGSAWTKLHRPIDLEETTEGDKAYEKYLTLCYMKKFGIDNVRGAGYSKSVGSYLGTKLETYLNNHTSIPKPANLIGI